MLTRRRSDQFSCFWEPSSAGIVPWSCHGWVQTLEPAEKISVHGSLIHGPFSCSDYHSSMKWGVWTDISDSWAWNALMDTELSLHHHYITVKMLYWVICLPPTCVSWRRKSSSCSSGTLLKTRIANARTWPSGKSQSNSLRAVCLKTILDNQQIITVVRFISWQSCLVNFYCHSCNDYCTFSPQLECCL